jgi:hypothetical protein
MNAVAPRIARDHRRPARVVAGEGIGVERALHHHSSIHPNVLSVLA